MKRTKFGENNNIHLLRKKFNLPILKSVEEKLIIFSYKIYLSMGRFGELTMQLIAILIQYYM